MIFESVDALKGTIRPLSLDCPLIAVTEDNVKDRLLHALGHLNAIANNNDSLETISYPSGGRQVAQMGPRFSSSALLQPPPRHPRKCRVVSATVWMPPPRPASSYTNYIQKNFPAPFFKAELACAAPVKSEIIGSLEMYSEVKAFGKDLLKAHGHQDLSEAFLQFQAYTRQARTFFEAAEALHHRASPLN